MSNSDDSLCGERPRVQDTHCNLLFPEHSTPLLEWMLRLGGVVEIQIARKMKVDAKQSKTKKGINQEVLNLWRKADVEL